MGFEREDRRDQRVAKLPRDRIADHLQHEVVLAGRQIRPVRLDAAGQDQTGGLAGLDCIADLHPGQIFRPDAVERLDRPRRVHFRCAALGGLGLLFGRELRSLRGKSDGKNGQGDGERNECLHGRIVYSHHIIRRMKCRLLLVLLAAAAWAALPYLNSALLIV